MTPLIQTREGSGGLVGWILPPDRGYEVASWVLSTNASAHTCDSFIFHLTKLVAERKTIVSQLGKGWGQRANTHEAGYKAEWM